jgi:hypothetical protein
MEIHDPDGLAWLRKIRKQLAEECGYDPKIMGDYYRMIQRRYSGRVVEDVSAVGDRDERTEKAYAEHAPD